MIVPTHRVIVPPEVVAAKEKLVEDLGGFEAHLAARASAAVRPDRRLGMENVVCIYVGEKVSGGNPTGEWAVKVQVLFKTDNPQRISAEALIDPQVQGTDVLTDIEQVPYFPSAYQGPEDFQRRERPSRCGNSIGRHDGTTGTQGCLVVANNNLYLMSNNHVLGAYNRGVEGVDDIIQPGLADAQVLANTFSIATLTKFVPLNLTNNQGANVAFSLADVALAWTGPEDANFRHHFFTIDKDMMDYSVGNMVVKKEGRTTGFTVGRIVGMNADVWVGYGPPAFPGGPATAPFGHFKDQLVIRSGNPQQPFSKPGDSGSLIVEYGSNCPVALLFAGNGTETFAHPFADVLTALAAPGVGFPLDKFVTSEADLE